MGTSLPSGLPELVADSEPLARFLIRSKWFSQTKLLVKAAAYMPYGKDGGIEETSVYRHAADIPEELWEIGRREILSRNTSLTLYGAAILPEAGIVRREGLDAVATEPPIRHAAIRNWPQFDSDPDMERARREEIALTLADQSRLLLNNP